MLQECDLGQQSVLHAVKAPARRRKAGPSSTQTINESSEFDDTGSKPMNETLTDLSLNEIDEHNISVPTGK